VKNSIESIPATRKGLIRLDSKINQNNLVITISDNGVGMDKQTKSKVGEAFFTTKKNGTGLGIKLSKEILEAHEGELHYRSSSKTGTKAIITIPLKKSLS
jgi:signal transduction histidine kinase